MTTCSPPDDHLFVRLAFEKEIARYSDALQLNHLSLGRQASDELAQVRVAGKKQHLAPLSGLSEKLGDRSRPGGIEVDEHVVENERQRHRTFREGLGERYPQTQVELLDAPTTQGARLELGARSRDDSDRLAVRVLTDRGQQLHVATLGHLGELLARPGEHGGLAFLLMATQSALEQETGASY